MVRVPERLLMREHRVEVGRDLRGVDLGGTPLGFGGGRSGQLRLEWAVLGIILRLVCFREKVANAVCYWAVSCLGAMVESWIATCHGG